MIKCVIVDDEPLAIALLSNYVRKCDDLRLLDGFSDALESIDYVNNNEVDLLFLDILMPDVTGISLLQKLNKKPVVIFTTAHRDFALDGYEIGIADYLLKPFDYERFQVSVERAKEKIRIKNGDSNLQPGIFIKSEYQLVRISFQEISFIESLDDYIRIHFKEGKPVITLMSLKAIAEKLPPQGFLRVHRRYIIAITRIVSIKSKKIVLADGTEIPVGDTFLTAVQDLSARL